MRWYSLGLVLLIAAPVAAQETFTIKIKDNPDQGKMVSSTETEKNSGTIKVLDTEGNVLDTQKQDETEEKVYTVTVLEKGEKAPKKYSQKFEKATKTVNGETRTLTYEGATIIYEKKGDKYEVSVEGKKEVSEEDLAELKKSANDRSDKIEEVLLPRNAVKVGDKWTIDTKELAKSFQSVGTLDPEKSKGEAVLKRVYKKGESQCGLIEVTLNLVLPGIEKLKFDTPATMNLTLTLDTAIDGSSTAGTMTMTGKMAGKASVTQMGMKFVVDMDMNLSGREERGEQK